MIQIRPYDNLGAMEVLRNLDASDRLEAILARGAECDQFELFNNWRNAQSAALLSHVFVTSTGKPFAVLAVVASGHLGVAQAALLSRSHKAFRRELAYAARQLREQLNDWATGARLHRIECRCWAEHPTAARFLSACGFKQEAICPGFGSTGEATFLQFAWIHPTTLTEA